MEVVVEQAVPMDLDAEFVVHDPEEPAEFDAITVGKEDRATIDSTVHHMVPAARRVGSELSCHRAILRMRCHGFSWGLTPTETQERVAMSV